MNSSVHDDILNHILILGTGPTQGLDYTTLTAEAQYSINFSIPIKIFCLSLHFIMQGATGFYFLKRFRAKN